MSIFVLTRKFSGTLPPTLFSLFLALYAQNHPTEKLQEAVKRNFPSGIKFQCKEEVIEKLISLVRGGWGQSAWVFFLLRIFFSGEISCMNIFHHKIWKIKYSIHWDPSFSRLLGRRKSVGIIGRFENSWVKLQCVTEAWEDWRQEVNFVSRGLRNRPGVLLYRKIIFLRECTHIEF